MIRLSVIVVNYNTSALLEKCLTSIMANSQSLFLGNEMELIVVDNGSKDNSVEILKTKFPNVVLVENKENKGFGKANNQGIEKANGEYVLLLNSDIEVIDQGIEKLYRWMKESNTEIGGGKLFNTDRSSQPSCGPFYSLPVVFIMLFLKGDKLGITRFSPSKVQEVDWVSGSCLMARKKIFKETGLFDENIFMYMDEIDFLYRTKEKGYKVFFFPEAKFIHLGSASSQGKSEPVLNIYKGLIYFYKKHKSDSQLILLRIMLKLKASLAFFLGVLTKNPNLWKTYGKAFKLA